MPQDTTQEFDSTSVESAARTSSKDSLILRRWLGAWIDFAVLALFLIIPDAVLGNALYRKTMWIWLLLIVLYFPLCEGLFGFTVGKLLGRLRVVNSEGHPPGIGKAIVRTLLRLFEVNPLLAGGFPAGIAVLLSKHRQRIGDMLAGTYVIGVSQLQAVKRQQGRADG